MIYNPERMAIDAVISMKRNMLNDENYLPIMEKTKQYYQKKIMKINITKGLIFSLLVVVMIYFIPVDVQKIYTTVPMIGGESSKDKKPDQVDFIKIY
jgi:uncharacterized membrane protein YesL